MRALLFTGLLGLAGLIPPIAPDAGADTPTDHVADAKHFVDLLANKDFASAEKMYDAAMKAALPEIKLGQTWTTINAQAGRFQYRISTRTETAGAFEVVYVTSQFEKMPLDVKVVFDQAGKVSGLYFLPAKPVTPWAAPEYCDASKFREQEVKVGSGEWVLPGTLTVPIGDGPFPAVVLVHGSGPHDRDEAIGPNKPFADLACGLASRGIAVLRYEKRTLVYGVKIAASTTLTVQEESIADALEAAKLLRGTTGIDPERIYVLGHSLGGMVAPRIGQQDPKLAGLILLAGSSRVLEDVIVEQLSYIRSLGGASTDEEKKQQVAIDGEIAKIKALDPKQPAPSGFILGAPAAYWIDLRSPLPADTARSLKMRMLILQGERDYQVTMTDFGIWKAALGERPDVTLKSYADLNHLFMTGTGKASPSEYQKAGHVAGAVVEDIAAWLLASKP